MSNELAEAMDTGTIPVPKKGMNKRTENKGVECSEKPKGNRPAFLEDRIGQRVELRGKITQIGNPVPYIKIANFVCCECAIPQYIEQDDAVLKEPFRCINPHCKSKRFKVNISKCILFDRIHFKLECENGESCQIGMWKHDFYEDNNAIGKIIRVSGKVGEYKDSIILYAD
jgi:DNA replicative helicase MCM subunit Mcm2 (Cdc46/Mcm family)